ncbi:MAG: GNAT family protein [Devosia sp.]|jgi:RimJ/RimL family protein N-acetyltransferase|nr:GNAT family protein [Devosia sp.]
MSNTDLPIDTERLVLRRFERDDIDELGGFYGLPEARRYLDLKARDKADVKKALETMRLQTRLTRPGDTLTLAVERKSDERLIGHVSLIWTDATASQAELRFFFDPDVRRQNYGAESLRRFLDLGFDEFGFHRVFARCGGKSQGSAKLLKDLGMRLEAHYREHALFEGEWDEELHFAILDREWKRGSKVKELHRNMVA